MSSTFTPPGDGWIEGVPDTDVGPVEIIRHSAWLAGKAQAGAEHAWYRPVVVHLRPGYYLTEHPTYAGGPIVVELLGGPDGEWVDAGDRGYLTDEQVAGLGRLQPLALVADVLDEVAEIEVTDPAGIVRAEIREGLELIARRFGVPR